MAEEASPLQQTALQSRFIIPSPVNATESDEDVPPSAQDPNAQHGGNSDNAQGAATISIPTVQAEMVQIAGPDDSARKSDVLYPAKIQESVEEDGGHEEEEEGDESDSELGDTGMKRRRKLREGIRRPRMCWRTVEVIDRSQSSDEDIQNRLNEIAISVYEKAGTAYPPGLLFLIMI